MERYLESLGNLSDITENMTTIMITEIINRICLVVHWIGFIMAVILIPMGVFALILGNGYNKGLDTLIMCLTLGGGPFLFSWLIRFILIGRKRLVPWE